MLQRCVASNRCCPKSRTEGFVENDQERWRDLYTNPYVSNDLVRRKDILQRDADYTSDAMALMYEPPQEEDRWDADSVDDWVEDVGATDDHVDMRSMSVSLPAKQRHQSPGSLGASLRQQPGVAASRRPGTGEGSSPGGGFVVSSASKQPPHVPRGPGAVATPNGLGVHELPSPPPPASRGGGGSPSGSPWPAAHQIGNPQLMSPGNRGALGAHGEARSPGFADLPAPPPPPSFRPQVATATATLPSFSPAVAPQSTPSGPVWGDSGTDTQPRSLSRSVREAQLSCTSEAGAASIAAIMQCVAQSQHVPIQQRPNSEKWTGRLKAYDVDGRRLHGA